MNADALFIELTTVTGLDRTTWEGILGLPTEIQADVLANYRAQDWSDPATPAFARVLEILGVLGSIAGVVGGVAGAAGAVAALRSA